MSRAIVTVEPRGDSKDDSGQLQAALDYLAANSTAGTLNLEAGTFTLNSTLEVPNGSGINIVGQGMASTTLQYAGDAAAEGIINFVGEGNNRHSFRDFTLSNPGKVLDYCIYGDYVHHSNFTRIRCVSAAESCVALGGWANTYVACEFSWATGAAIHFRNQLNINGTTLVGCKLLLSGWGVRATTCKQLGIIGCVIEGNTIGGVLVNNCWGVSVDSCYFEVNALTGYALTGSGSEAVTIQADIVLLGNQSDLDGMDYNFPVRGFSASGNYHSDDSGVAPYYIGSVFGGSVDSCYSSADTNLVQTYWDEDFGRIYNLRVSNNDWAASDTKQVLGFHTSPTYPLSYSYPMMQGVTIQGNSNDTRRCRVDLLRDNRDLTTAAQLVAGTGGTIAASAEKFHGYDAYTWSVYGTDTFGFTVDMTQYRGRLFRLSIAYKKNDAPENGGIRVYVENLGADNQGFIGATAGWEYRMMVFEVDAAWTAIDFGFQHIGAATDIHVSHLQLTEIGMPLEVQAW